MIPDVTPEQAAAAFTQYGIQPERGTYGMVNDDGVFCGCVLTALYAIYSGDLTNTAGLYGITVEGCLEERDVSDAWRDGVVDGFDETKRADAPRNDVFFEHLDDEDQALFLNGFYFGRDVARLVFGVEAEEGTV